MKYFYKVNKQSEERKQRKRLFSKRFLSVFLCIALITTYLPISAMIRSAEHVNRVADPSTMNEWKDFFLPNNKISTENAGGVWMDKSVFTDAADFADTGIAMDASDSFLIALSAIAANMSVTGMSHVPTDTMLVLDVSGSMNDNQGNNDVAEELVEAANESIASLLSTNSYNRVGVVLYSGPATQGGAASANDAVLVLPLGRYTTGNDGQYLSYSVSSDRGSTTETVSLDTDVVYEGTATKPAARSKNVVGATYIQKGVALAMNQFLADGNATTVNDPSLGTITRRPVMVLMSDGAPTVGSTEFTAPDAIQLGDGTSTSAAMGFVNQLTAAYAKAQIEDKYKTDSLFYTLGLGVSNDSVATSVLDPANSSTAIDDFWEQYNAAQTGATVTVQSGGRWQPTRTVTKISTALEQTYVDKYFAVSANSDNLAEDLKQAFADIVGTIQLQSQYTPTLITESEDLSGYISFVDKIGEYMNVTDVKGVLIHNTLFSGHDLASNFVTGGGALGTYDNPTELGKEMVAAVRARLGLQNDDTARTLIGLAYQYGQISYDPATEEYSNYIGWYANAAGQFLGFYHEGVTVLPAATGNAATDPAFTVKSYGYLGEVDEAHGVSKSDMMYATVQVRENISTGEELVTFAVPAALIPVLTYDVTLNSEGELIELEASGAEHPIRLVYEVALDSSINEWNVKEAVSAEYLAENTNPDGTVSFYTNKWDHTNTTGYGTVNTYSYFNPSRQNDKYYFVKEAPVYADTAGTLYAGTAQPSGVMYQASTVYEKDGNRLDTRTVYRRISDAALATAVQIEGTNNWVVPAGNVHVNLEGYTVYKGGLTEYDPDANRTGTLNQAFLPFVDTHNHSIGDLGYNFYVGATLGNNGKLTLTPETGIKLTKTLAADATDTDKDFTFVLTNTSSTNDSSSYPAVHVSEDGTETPTTVSFAGGAATVSLSAGETLYIGGMNENDVIEITETPDPYYIVSGVTVDGTAASDPASATVTADRMTAVEFVNADRGIGNLTIAKEVEHDFGLDYQIPADKAFDITVTLTGLGTANATFAAAKTGSSITEVTTDADGSFTVTLRHNEQFEVFGLPESTQATVVEETPGAGFAAQYYNNDEPSNASYGSVTVKSNATVSVVVENDYTPARVYPVNVSVSGTKQLTGRDWQDSDTFTFELQKFMGYDAQTGQAQWSTLDSAAASKASQSFTFTDAFANEAYDTPGTYYYRVVELEPANKLAGVSYDKTVHSFSVIVGDGNMDGVLEITEVVASRDTTHVTQPSANSWNVAVDFNNVYAATGQATVTIDLNKRVTDENGNPLTQPLSGYQFGLYDGDELVDTSAKTTERGFARFVLNYTAAGTYSYTLKEIIPTPVPAGWTYSTAEIPVTVVVEDDPGTATFKAVIYQGDTQPADASGSISTTFTNVYNPADATLEIDFVKKQIDGRDLENEEFSFEVQTIDGDTVLTGTNDTDGAVTFNDTLKFNAAGTYSYHVVETSADGNGVTVDKNAYHIIVTVTDAGGKLEASYTIINIVGDSIVFENKYQPAAVPVELGGSKQLDGRVLLNDEFTFVLTEALDADGNVADGAKAYETKNFADGTFSFPEITYTKAGTYYYVASEQQNGGSSYGIHYDTTKYVVTVSVTDNTELGKLEASVTYKVIGGSSATGISFKNEYIPEPTSASLPGNKVLTGHGKVLEGEDFSFELYEARTDWTAVRRIQTVTNAQDGSFGFTAVDYKNNDAAQFTSTGTYYYLIKEVNGGSEIDGITYDDIVYRVRVEITDDLLGQLHATVHIYDNNNVPQESVEFNNTYEITGGDTLELSGTKVLNDEIPEDRVFTFELYETGSDYAVSGNPAETTTQDENGDFHFSIAYGPEDIAASPFYYTVKEANAGQTIEGVTYDNTEYHIEVTVSDNGVGGVDSTAVIKKGGNTATGLAFSNQYTAAKTTYTFEGIKELGGIRPLKENDFTFEIFHATPAFEIGSSAAPSVKNDRDGNFKFSEIDLTEAKTYYFVVKENSENPIGGVTYDASKYHISVKVIDDGRGKLEVEKVTYTRVTGDSSAAAESILFENSYSATDATVSITGSKALENRTLAESEFAFLLYPADESFEIDPDADASRAVNREDGTFAFDALTFSEAGTYYFVVAEDKEVSADRITFDATVYHLTIAVSDDENGKLVASDPVITKAGSSDPVEAIAFTNVYTPKPADITVHIRAHKTVVNKGSESIGPEGFAFVLENTETADKFSLKSDADGNAVFTLSYTEDDIGKTYTYRLTEVNDKRANVQYSTAEYTIRVAVSLNENNELTAELTKDGAAAEQISAEFVNVYDYTAPGSSDTPQTGNNGNLNLLFILLFISGGSVIGTSVYRKKKRM